MAELMGENERLRRQIAPADVVEAVIVEEAG
jgi:hypothetical protein